VAECMVMTGVSQVVEPMVILVVESMAMPVA
jgi:hypothetical protein